MHRGKIGIIPKYLHLNRMLCGVFRNVEISSCVCSVLRCGRTKAERGSLHSFVVGSCSPSAARRTPLVKQEKNLKRSNVEGGGGTRNVSFCCIRYY